ncbi:MAG: hypothetical protein RLZZ175_1957 [Bacteroidota bacterium]|jgi:hypothetical protein
MKRILITFFYLCIFINELKALDKDVFWADNLLKNKGQSIFKVDKNSNFKFQLGDIKLFISQNADLKGISFESSDSLKAIFEVDSLQFSLCFYNQNVLDKIELYGYVSDLKYNGKVFKELSSLNLSNAYLFSFHERNVYKSTNDTLNFYVFNSFLPQKDKINKLDSLNLIYNNNTISCEERVDFGDFLNIIKDHFSIVEYSIVDPNEQHIFYNDLYTFSNGDEVKIFWDINYCIIYFSDINTGITESYTIDKIYNFKGINDIFQYGKQLVVNNLKRNISIEKSIIQFEKYNYFKERYSRIYMPENLQEGNWVDSLVQNNKYNKKISTYNFSDTTDLTSIKSFFSHFVDFEKVIFETSDSLIIKITGINKLYSYNIGVKSTKKKYFFTIYNMHFTDSIDSWFINKKIEYYFNLLSSALNYKDIDFINKIIRIQHSTGIFMHTNEIKVDRILEIKMKCNNCFKEIKMTDAELDTVLSFFRDSYMINHNLSDCDFNPHDAIMIYNQKQLVASIQICYECNELIITNHKEGSSKKYAFISFSNSKSSFLTKSEQQLEGSFSSEIEEKNNELVRQLFLYEKLLEKFEE